MQYAEESRWDNLDIVVYPGADAEFTLYEDEGDNYNYEKGVYSTITFKWNDKKRTLSIGAVKGQYPGMLAERAFNVRVAGEDAVQTMRYDGNALSVKL